MSTATIASTVMAAVEQRLKAEGALDGARLISAPAGEETAVSASATVPSATWSGYVAPWQGASSEPTTTGRGGTSQIISGTVDDPLGPISPATGGTGAEMGTPDPLSAFGSNGTPGGAGNQIITGTVDDPLGTLSGADVNRHSATRPAATKDGGTPPAGAGNQIITGTVDDPLGGSRPATGLSQDVQSWLQHHRLIDAMASFGGSQASPMTSSIAQTEIEAARGALAASLHY